MGWDVTYHPIAAEEIQTVYFKGLDDPEYYKTLAEQFSVHEFYVEQMKNRFDEARAIIGPDTSFATGHAYFTAIISGFLRKHWYIRGSAFSFLVEEDEAFAPYASDWKPLVPARYQGQHFDNKLTQNYCGGVFLSHAALRQLRADYQSNAHIRKAMDELFSHGRLAVFWKAVDYSIEHNLGLLEASEVVEPNPMDLQQTKSLSNLFNCETEGALLYAEAAQEQIRELEAAEKQDAEPPKKKGFFSSIFGKDK